MEPIDPQKYIGRKWNKENETELRLVLEGFRIRVWYPDTVGTMDYRTDRYNISVDEDGTITKINIG